MDISRVTIRIDIEGRDFRDRIVNQRSFSFAELDRMTGVGVVDRVVKDTASRLFNQACIEAERQIAMPDAMTGVTG